MTRWQADLLLALASLIWGFDFVPQKVALDHIGPFAFVAARFLTAALFMTPLVWREKPGLALARLGDRHLRRNFLLLLVAFAAAVILQQCGLLTTTATKTAFMTGLYVVIVPFVAYAFYRHRFSAIVLAACLLSVLGVGLLSGAGFDQLLGSFSFGDILVLLSASAFALQVSIVGSVGTRLRAPFALSFMQYLAVGLVALLLAAAFEQTTWNGLWQALGPILFAGIAAGSFAYTLQTFAQQHTPPSDAAIIMSLESLFGGVFSVWLLHEPLTIRIAAGCGAILLAILLIEAGPLLAASRRWRSRKRP